MPSYYLTCECGQMRQVNPSRAGDSLTCICGRTNVIPSMGKLTRRDKATWNSETNELEGKTGVELSAISSSWKVAVLSAPRVRINGITHNAKWGKQFYSLTPGDYDIEVYLRWVFWRIGTSRERFSVKPDCVVEIDYRFVPNLFLEGEINIRT